MICVSNNDCFLELLTDGFPVRYDFPQSINRFQLSQMDPDDGLRHIFDIFSKQINFFWKILKRISKTMKFEYADLCVNHPSMFKQNFSYQSPIQTDFETFKKKIWCASRARVNLPHIGNSKCIKFVLQRFFF
jgi:hypothetical protein